MVLFPSYQYIWTAGPPGCTDRERKGRDRLSIEMLVPGDIDFDVEIIDNGNSLRFQCGLPLPYLGGGGNRVVVFDARGPNAGMDTNRLAVQRDVLADVQTQNNIAFDIQLAGKVSAWSDRDDEGVIVQGVRPAQHGKYLSIYESGKDDGKHVWILHLELILADLV